MRLENFDLDVNVVVGIDFTASNEYRRNLHRIKNEKTLNSYQKTLKFIDYTIASLSNMSLFNETKLSLYGFGDSVTKDHSVFKFYENSYCAVCSRDILIK